MSAMLPSSRLVAVFWVFACSRDSSAFASSKTVGGESDESDGSRAGATVFGLWSALDRESIRFLSTITIKDVADGNLAATKIGAKVVAQAA